MNKSFDFSILQRTAELGGVMDLETAEKWLSSVLGRNA